MGWKRSKGIFATETANSRSALGNLIKMGFSTAGHGIPLRSAIVSGFVANSRGSSLFDHSLGDLGIFRLSRN